MPTSEPNQIVAQCREEYQAGLKYRLDREKSWHTIEDFYFNKVKKNLKGKFNAPVPIIPGFVDTWQAKMAKHVNLTFEINHRESEYRAVQKTNGLLQAQKDHEDYDWDMMDTDGKKMAAIYGRVPYKYYAYSKPEYKSCLELVDPYDMSVDPIGGGVDERHRFKHQDNIFRSKSELKEGAETEKVYEAGQVSKLINATQEDVIVDNDNTYKSKQNRLLSLGLNGILYNYAGQTLYKLIESGTTWKGKRYYVVWNYETGIWVRCEPLKDVFQSNLWPWTSWATNRDTFNYWSKSPCDDMLPLAEVIRVLINQEIDNRNKKNYGMRGYDPELIPDPSQLEWRQDGLVAFKSGSAKLLGDMSKATFEFQTPDLNGTIDLATYLDNMLKEKTGVNSESQGQTDTQKVGIAYLNVQQSTERTALTYESYTKCWQGIGRRYLWGLKEHMRGPMAVKIMGEKGAEWDELARMEINPEWGIKVSGGEDDINKDEIKKKALTGIFATMTPDELAVTNPKWRVKIKLQAAEVEDDEILLAFDKQDESNREVLSRASKMIEDVLDNKPVKPFRGATTTFVQKIIDYATDEDLKMKDYMALMGLAQAHIQIAAQNAARKLVLQQQVMMAQQQAGQQPGQPQPAQPQGGPGAQGALPPQPPLTAAAVAPNTPGGTQSQSQGMTQLSPQPQQVTA